MKSFKSLVVAVSDKSAAIADKVCNKSAAIAGAGIGVATFAGEKLASAAPTASGIVDWADAADGVKAEMSPALTAAIGVGMIVLGIVIGYAIFKRFARG